MGPLATAAQQAATADAVREVSGRATRFAALAEPALAAAAQAALASAGPAAARGRQAGRLHFTLAEDKALAQWVSDHAGWPPQGRKLWEQAERAGLTRHPWAGMQNRWRRYVRSRHSVGDAGAGRQGILASAVACNPATCPPSLAALPLRPRASPQQGPANAAAPDGRVVARKRWKAEVITSGQVPFHKEDPASLRLPVSRKRASSGLTSLFPPAPPAAQALVHFLEKPLVASPGPVHEVPVTGPPCRCDEAAAGRGMPQWLIDDQRNAREVDVDDI